MRVVFFTNSYKPVVSGVVTSINTFREALQSTGHQVSVIAPSYEGYVDEEPNVFRFPSIDLRHQVDLSIAMPFPALIAPTIHGLKPQIIHSHHPFLLGEVAAAFAWQLRVPLVFTFHTRYDAYARTYVPIAAELASLVTEQIVDRYLDKCQCVIAPTPTIRDLIQRTYRFEAPVHVVPTPVDLSAYRDLHPERVLDQLDVEGCELLLYVGRLAAEKNLDFMLRSFRRIAAQRPKARLALVGKGPYEGRLRALIAELQLGDRVLMAGAIPYAQVPDFAAAAKLFLFCSLTDTQGLVLIEAMAAGTPIVAVEAPGAQDALYDGGGVLTPASEERFADAVLDLLADENRRHQLASEALRVASRYTVEAVTECLVNAYEDAVAQLPSVAPA